MKVTIDGQDLFELTEIQKKVLKNDIKEEIFEEDMKRRVFYIVNHKYEQSFKRLKKEWEPKLAKAGIESIPTNKDAFAQLVFSQPDYKDRSTRDAEETAIK